MVSTAIRKPHRKLIGTTQEVDWQSTGSEIPQEVESQRKFIGTPQEVDWQHTGSRIPEEVDWNPTGSRTPQEVLKGARESESSSSRRRSEAEARKKKKELLNLASFLLLPAGGSREQLKRNSSRWFRGFCCRLVFPSVTSSSPPTALKPAAGLDCGL